MICQTCRLCIAPWGRCPGVHSLWRVHLFVLKFYTEISVRQIGGQYFHMYGRSKLCDFFRSSCQTLRRRILFDVSNIHVATNGTNLFDGRMSLWNSNWWSRICFDSLWSAYSWRQDSLQIFWNFFNRLIGYYLLHAFDGFRNHHYFSAIFQIAGTI